MAYFKVFSIIAAVLMAVVVVAQPTPRASGAVGPARASKTRAGGWQSGPGPFKTITVNSGGDEWVEYQCNGNTVPTSCSCIGVPPLTLISSLPWPEVNPTSCWCQWYNGASSTQTADVRVFAYCSD